MKLSYYRRLGGGVTVCLAYRAERANHGPTVASFSNDVWGETAFWLFKSALAKDGESTLFNEDSGEYDVGTLDQLNP